MEIGFRIPTLSELATRTARAFRGNLKGSDAALWPNNVAVAAKVIAGAVWEPFSFLRYITRQIFVHTADGPFVDRHAAEYGMVRLPASFAAGEAVLFGDANVTVPAGLTLERADGLRFETTTSGATNSEGSVTVAVRALAAGRSSNTPVGAMLTLTAAFDRIHLEGEVGPAGISGGADEESDESLRQRVWFRKKMPPHGGAAHDYVAWMREIGGVSRVFVDPVSAFNGRNSVGVWFLMDDIYPDGIPMSADVSRASAYIDQVRPAGAIVAVAAPIPVTIDVSIVDLVPDTTVVRNAIIAELSEMFRRVGRVSTLTEPFTLHKSNIVEAISIATGEMHHTVASPTDDIAFGVGQIPVLGTVTFS